MNILLFLLILLPFTLSKIVPKVLEQLNVNIWAERHRSIHTDYISVNTRVHTDSPPLKRSATIREMNGEDKCEVSLHLHLCGDHLIKRNICLYSENLQDSFARVVEPGTSLNLAQMDLSLKNLQELVNPVIGFVANEPNSLVKGYIIKKQFYGTIRIYDKHRLYHVVYYIEPLSVIPLYNGNYKNQDLTYKPDHNAVIFEYVSHSAKAQWLECGPKSDIVISKATTPHGPCPDCGETKPVSSDEDLSEILPSSEFSKAKTDAVSSTSPVTAAGTRFQNVSSPGGNVTQKTTISAPSTRLSSRTSQTQATESVALSASTKSSASEFTESSEFPGKPSTKTMAPPETDSEENSGGQTPPVISNDPRTPAEGKPASTLFEGDSSTPYHSTNATHQTPPAVSNVSQTPPGEPTETPSEGDSSTPYHSTDIFFLFHSTQVSPLTGEDFGRQILGHSTEATTKFYPPPHHSTDGSTLSTVTQTHSTGVTPLGHSTDSTPYTIDYLKHMTEMDTAATHSTHKEETTTFRPSTEVTRDDSGYSDSDDLPSIELPETMGTTLKTTTRKILDSNEILAQLSTEIIPWPFHSTEKTQDTRTTTPSTTRRYTLDYSIFSTEVTPVTLVLNHSTVATTEEESIEYGGGTTRRKHRTKPTTTMATIALNHSTQFPAHSTQVTRTTLNVTFNADTTKRSTGPSTSSHLDHSTQPMFHSTVVTARTTTIPETSTSTTQTTTAFELKHSTDAKTSPQHSTEVTRPTSGNPGSFTTTEGTTTGMGTTATTPLIHSTEKFVHSTDGIMPITPTPKTTTEKTTTTTTTVATTTSTSTTTPTTTPTTVTTTTLPSTTSGVIHSTMRPFHSTDPPNPNDDKKRKKREINLNSFFLENVLEEEDKDVDGIVPFSKGTVESDIFDMKSDKSFICTLCIWIQPHFAESFGLGGGLLHGVAEVLDLIKFTDQIFRAIDFNQDGIPENIGFKVKKLLLSDEISINKNGSQKDRRRRKREYMDDGLTDLFGNLYEPGLMEDAYRDKREDFEFNSYGSYDKYDDDEMVGKNKIQNKPRTGSSEKELLEKNLNQFARDPKKLDPAHGLTWIANQLDQFKDCCSSLGFIYHDLTPTVAATTERGLCSEKNLGLISGMQHEHKILKYDVFRGIMHSLGHLFGASHTPFADPDCFDEQLYDFINPFPLHPIQQSNVGMRPNSFRFSPCTKDSITIFLASNGPSCLREEGSSFCGNGVVDEGEDCDCGSLWQCHLRYPCCGESDTLMGCKVIIETKNTCFRPTIW